MIFFPILLIRLKINKLSACNIFQDEFVDRLNSPTLDESRISQDYDSEPLKDFVTTTTVAAAVSATQQTISYEPECKIKIDNSMSPIIKNEVNLEEKLKFELISTSVMENIVKPEKLDVEDDCKSETPMDVTDCKDESFELKCETSDIERNEENNDLNEIEKNDCENNQQESVVNKLDVEMECQNDDEMDAFSSPMRESSSEGILKQRVANMRLEFNANVQKVESKCEVEKMDDKSDVEFDFDEFDVEAQMKKITGDDGDDYKEKVDTSSEKDKSMDGLEGLMDSSKEDSDSELEKEVEDFKSAETLQTPQETVEERAFKVNI